MSKSVFGIATTEGQAERIVEHLQAEGFATSEISVLNPLRRPKYIAPKTEH